MVRSSDTQQAAKSPSPPFDVSKAERAPSGQLAAIRRFRDVDQIYARASEQALLAAQRRCEDAHRRHAEALVALQQDTQSKLEQAYKAGADAWDASRSDDVSAQYQELNRQYLAATNSILGDARARFADGARALHKECEDTGRELDAAARSAYRDYLLSLQDAWHALDVDAIVDGCALAQAVSPRM